MDRVVVGISAAAADFADIEAALERLDEVPGVDLHEDTPDTAVLRSSGWQAVLISVTSAGGLKMVRDVLVAHIAGRRMKLSITRAGTKVTYDGPIGNSDEVERIVRELTADEPPE